MKTAAKPVHGGPLLTVVLTTRSRPAFLRLALRFYREQVYAPRELVVIDDSDAPSQEPGLRAPDVSYIYLEEPLPLGSKLNLGIKRSCGEFILKMDDDDYYGPDFLLRMVEGSRNRNPRNSISFLQPFLFLRLSDLQVLQADPDRCSGATFFFHREYWTRCQFRDVPEQVDAHFLLDHGAEKQSFNCVNAIESFLQVRHDRHLWNCMPNGEPLNQYLARQAPYPKSLRNIVTDWAYEEYERMSWKLNATHRDTKSTF